MVLLNNSHRNFHRRVGRKDLEDFKASLFSVDQQVEAMRGARSARECQMLGLDLEGEIYLCFFRLLICSFSFANLSNDLGGTPSCGSQSVSMKCAS
jgi:hypothetical protein